jgi:hypothetical protein
VDAAAREAQAFRRLVVPWANDAALGELLIIGNPRWSPRNG